MAIIGYRIGIVYALLLECYSYFLWARGGYSRMGAHSWGGGAGGLYYFVR